MKWLAEIAPVVVLAAVAALAIVFSSLDQRDCAKTCGSGGYVYTSGCCDSTKCVCTETRGTP